MKNRAFTLVETLIAIAVLSISITGPLSLASKSLVAASYAKEQIAAFYLAQEALDVIRYVRDNNSLDSQNWLTGLGNCTAPNACVIDAQTKGVFLCAGGVCPRLQQVDSAGERLFGQNMSGSPVNSIYTRRVQITAPAHPEINNPIPPSNATIDGKVTVTMTWSSKFGPRSFVVSENLFDWK